MATKWLAGIASMRNFRVAALHRLNSPTSSSDASNSCSMRFAAAARTTGVPLLDSSLRRWRVRSMSAFPDSTDASIPKETLDGTPDGPGSAEPNEPPEVSSTQDKVVPEAAEDKRMWRKWIEERLTQSGSAGKETDSSLSKSSQVEETVRSSLGSGSNTTDYDISFHGSSRVKETAKRSVVREKRPGSLSANNSFLEEDGEGPSGSDDSSAGKKLSPLDSLLRSALMPASKDYISLSRLHTGRSVLVFDDSVIKGTAEDSTVSNFRNPFRRDNASSSVLSDTASNKNSRTADRRGSLFQESAKRSSFFSDRQAARNAPQDDLDDFEYRVLGSANDEDDSVDDDFLRDLDEIGRSVRGTTSDIDENLDMGEDDDWSDEKANVLTDLALSNMEVFDLEDEENPYRMRSDRLFFPGQTYDPEDLDLSKEAAIEKPTVRTRKRYPSKEVFQVADFRNPRYLSKFIRESSRILPRRHFQISAKAQRKVAREIKTARILGLMPFTSMGDPPFRFLRSRSEDDTNAGHDDY